MKFFNSPNFSLLCCALNTAFGVNAVMTQAWPLAGLCFVFAAVCYNNYRNAT